MNKIYKVVWSKVKHCYVVTSELAKRQTKGCGARRGDQRIGETADQRMRRPQLTDGDSVPGCGGFPVVFRGSASGFW